MPAHNTVRTERRQLKARNLGRLVTPDHCPLPRLRLARAAARLEKPGNAPKLCGRGARRGGRAYIFPHGG